MRDPLPAKFPDLRLLNPIRREKVEFILPGSTTALKKIAGISVLWASLTFWHPSEEGQKRWGLIVAAKNPNVGYAGAFARVSLLVATGPNGDSNHQRHQLKQ